MVFNSLVFGVFLATVLAVHHLWPRRLWTGEKVILVLASLLFYGWWDVRFLSLLVLSTIVDWAAVSRIRARPEGRTPWLLLSLIFNLGALGFFKYWSFFVDSAKAALLPLGVDPAPLHLDVVLPVGISFYTFQTMSLTLDAWRGRLRSPLPLLDAFLYVSFFPQLVAGPIVRADDFLPQVRRKPRFRTPLFLWGCWLLWLGLFKKVVIADNLALLVDRHFGSGDLSAASALASWKTLVAFSLQIYGDFSGYSDVALGAAALLGIRFRANFRSPYVAASFSDFWRRWHISLSTWLRDYLYVPLGGNRGGEGARRRNLLVTMLLGGLWHGASWNFVLWGGLHGLLLGAERALFGKDLRTRSRALATDLARTGLVFLGVTLLWLPFRSRDPAQTLSMLGSLFGAGRPSALADLGGDALVFSAGLLVVASQFARERGILPRRGPWWGRAIASALMLYAVANLGGRSHAFIYFRF